MFSFTAFLIGTATGVIGTGAGAAAAWLIRKSRQAAMGTILNFAAGLMLAMVCFELIPEAFEHASLYIVLIGIGLGIIFVWLTQKFTAYIGKSRLSAVAMTLALGIAVHNIPEGLAVGASLYASYKTGIALSLTIFIHDIPEGVGIGLPLRIEGKSIWTTVIYASLAGLPTGFGALAGALAGSLSNITTALCLSSAGGAMLYLVMDEMLPEAGKLNDKQGFSAVIGVLCGVILTNLL